jgi:ATP-dependent DNA ligase
MARTKITPMLLESLKVDEARKLFYEQKDCFIVEQKVDGVRGYIKDGKLYDRRNVDITARFPEFIGIEQMGGILDGEIVCASGDFGDVASRMHLKDKFLMRLAQEKNPAKFIVFDFVAKNGDDRPLMHRKAKLKILMTMNIPQWIEMLEWKEDFDELWAQVELNGWEGLVMKRKDGVYEWRRSKNALKVKAFEETKTIFTKYEEHPRGITIETEDGRRVNINGAQAPIVKHKLLREGKVLCKVQFMKSALDGSDAWRFPSFRGIVEEDDGGT